MNRGILLTPLLLLAGCGGYEPDMPELENRIAVDLADQIDAKADQIDLNCPDSIEWRVGDEFRCYAEDDRGNRVQIVVHMENDEGDLTWEVAR